MSASLYALGRWCYRRRGRVVAIWLALLAVLGGLAITFQGSFDDAFEIPGSSSSDAFDRLHMTFPEATAVTATAMIVAPEGNEADEEQAAIETAIDDFLAVPTIDEALSPWDDMVDGTVSDDGRAAMMQLNLNVTETPTSEQLAEITEVGNALESQLPDGWQVAMGGQAFNIQLPALSIIEAVGLIVALVVLTVVLGSLVAAGLPLITAVVGVGIAMAILLLVTRVAAISSTTPILAVMLGLAVGIDYALFILSRHRDELRKGADPEESTGRAVGTAGSAVVFAGLTVFIALLGLGVANIPFLTVMGVFAALAVAFGVIIALTMLPALMGYLGERMRPKPKAERATKRREGGAFSWWVGVTTKHPIVTVVAVIIALGTLALPAAGLRLSLPHSGQNPSTAQDRIAYDLVAEHFGPGFNGPLIVTVDIINSDDPIEVIDGIAADIEATDGVAAVPLATPNANVDTGLIQVVPTTAPDDPATQDLANALRDLEDHWQETYGVDTAVTGITAIQNDISARLGGALLPFGVLVVGLSLVLLAAVFRSVWVPVKATVGYLLSVGAAFGATALVFNEGWFMGLVNLEQPMAVISFLPILLMGILFGLAMDYEVFLVSRMREEYVHGKSALEAVRSGFVASGPVVVAAALIMFAVFAFFVPEGMGPIKQIAFALAVGVAVDAFLIRMTFVPAALALLGDRAWWLPGWLDRLLPTFDVEGETLTRERAGQLARGRFRGLRRGLGGRGRHRRLVVARDARQRVGAGGSVGCPQRCGAGAGRTARGHGRPCPCGGASASHRRGEGPPVHRIHRPPPGARRRGGAAPDRSAAGLAGGDRQHRGRRHGGAAGRRRGDRAPYPDGEELRGAALRHHRGAPRRAGSRRNHPRPTRLEGTRFDESRRTYPSFA